MFSNNEKICVFINNNKPSRSGSPAESEEDMKGDYISNRTFFFNVLDSCCNGTVMSWNDMDYMKVTETVIENVTIGTRYFKGLDF